MEFLGSEEKPIMTAKLMKVYCYRDGEKQIWYEVEDNETGQGISWSPEKSLAVSKAEKHGYKIADKDNPVIKFYRAAGGATQ